jgi:general secretion pathway protein A
MKTVIDLWPGNSENGPLPLDVEDDQVFFKVAARQNGLLVQRVEGDWDPLLNLNLPAVLEFYLQGGGLPRYLTLAKINDEGAILLGGPAEGGIQVHRDQLTSYWSRVAYVAWKDFLNLPEVLSPQSSGDAVLTLKLFMQEIGYKDIEITPIYDESTMKVVKQIQQKYGIRTDGIVGPMTKIALYNEKASLGIPHLVEE